MKHLWVFFKRIQCQKIKASLGNTVVIADDISSEDNEKIAVVRHFLKHIFITTKKTPLLFVRSHFFFHWYKKFLFLFVYVPFSSIALTRRIMPIFVSELLFTERWIKYLSKFFYLLFAYPTAKFGPLTRAQPRSSDFNHCVFQFSIRTTWGALSWG